MTEPQASATADPPPGDSVRRRSLHWGLRVLVWVGLLYFMLRWFEQRQVYHPTRTWDATGDVLRRPYEDLTLTARDGVRLSAWYFPGEPASPRPAWAFLICHGNGGNISHRTDLYQALLETGASVLAFDYRGYGKSEGRPGEAGTYLDAQAAWAWLVQRGYPPERIVAYGESLGGGVASELARRERLGGLVLQSSFTSVPDLGAELFPWLPVRWISRIAYDTRSRLPLIDVPVLILHSREDRLIPFHHAERNFAAAREPKRIWEIAGDHNDTFEADRTRVVEGVRRFLDERARTGNDSQHHPLSPPSPPSSAPREP